jgi:hypothetical protein
MRLPFFDDAGFPSSLNFIGEEQRIASPQRSV